MNLHGLGSNKVRGFVQACRQLWRVQQCSPSWSGGEWLFGLQGSSLLNFEIDCFESELIWEFVWCFFFETHFFYKFSPGQSVLFSVKLRGLAAFGELRGAAQQRLPRSRGLWIGQTAERRLRLRRPRGAWKKEGGVWRVEGGGLCFFAVN